MGKPTWVEKGKSKSFIVLTSLKEKIEQRWYFDNGSSRHMTGNKWFLFNILPSSLDSMTFGDNAKGSIMGSGSFKRSWFAKIKGCPC